MRIQKVSFTLQHFCGLLISILLVCGFPLPMVAQDFSADLPGVDYEGDVFKRNGYTYEMGAPKGDTSVIEDPITGEVHIRYKPGNPQPASVNGVKVYNLNEVTTPPRANIGGLSLADYLLQNLKDEFISFSNYKLAFRIDLFNVIVDDKGKVVFYECDGVRGYGEDRVERRIANVVSTKINKLLSDMPAMTPALRNGKPVAAYTDVYLKYYKIEVKDQKAFYTRNPPDAGGRYH